MDIAGLSTALSSARLHNEVGIAMLSKTMDQSEAAGDGLLRMIDASAMERSVTPHIGANIDLSV